MTFGVSRGVAVDDAGNVVPNVRVEVRRMVPGFPLAVPIYADADGVAGLDNYFVSASGEWEFYAVGGLYRVHVFTVGGGYDKTWDNVPVGTAQAADVDHYAQAGFTWAPESATASPPTDGCIRFNNADVSAATHAYISKDTLGGSDATTWLTAFVPNDWLLAATGVGIEVGWPVAAITSHGTWFDIQLGTYAGPVGPLSFGDSGFVSVAREKAPLTQAGTTIIKTTAGNVVVGASDGTVILNKAVPEATGITLPAVAARNGLALHIVDYAGNGGDITITPDGAEKVMGLATATLVSNGQGAGLAASITLYPNTTLGGWTQ